MADPRKQKPLGKREPSRDLPAVSASKKEKTTQVKRRSTPGQKRTMASASKSHTPVKKLAVEEGVRSGKNTVHQLQAQACATTQEDGLQGPLLLSQPPEPSSVPHTSASMGQQAAASLSGEAHGSSAMASMCSSQIIPPRAANEPVLLQPQGAGPSNQALDPTAVEWQEMLEAAEALLALKNSSQSRRQLGGRPGPSGERGLQLSSPSLSPRPSNSGSLPAGHLDYMSLLT